MNRVTPQTPLEEILSLMNRDGYVLMENALAPAQLAEIRAAYDEQVERNTPSEPTQRIELRRTVERDQRFEQLMDHSPVFRIVRVIIGPDIELATGGEIDHKCAHTPSHISWHNDFNWMSNVPYPRQNFWIRCTYFLSDVAPNGGAFTLLPGSHLNNGPCPEDEGQEPRYIEGQLGITGAAGSCLINNTEIWHTNSPNTSDDPRRLIMILYKHGWMKPWLDGYEISPEFTARQTDPLRRQLCGGYAWHNPAASFPANNWQFKEAA